MTTRQNDNVFEHGECLLKATAINDDGSIRNIKYFIDFKLHRIGAPSYIDYYSHSNVIHNESWNLYGVPHREDGPADRSYHPSGNLASEVYIVNGEINRSDGPAIITYDDETGLVKEEYYYKYGTELSSEQVEMLGQFEECSLEWKFTYDML